MNNNSNAGTLLKKARLKKELSVEEIAHEMKITPCMLYLIEKNDWQKLPQSLYTKSFIYQYASFLKINLKPLVYDYLSGFPKKSAIIKKKDLFLNQAGGKWQCYLLF